MFVGSFAVGAGGTKGKRLEGVGMGRGRRDDPDEPGGRRMSFGYLYIGGRGGRLM